MTWRALLAAVAVVAAACGCAAGPVAAEQASEPGSPAAAQLDLGASFSCAIVTGGQVRCWGYGGEGELGYPGVTSVGAVDTPASVGPVDIGAGFTAKSISSGDYHTCVIRNDSSVLCWGFGADGRLGYGNTNNVGDTETPGSVGPVDLGAGRTAVAISAGGAHTCAILDNGSVLCWGYGAYGQLGYGNANNVGNTPADTPKLVGPVSLGAGRTAVAISAGDLQTCAIMDDGSVRCWGDGYNGQLGYGNRDSVADGRAKAAGGTDPSVASAGAVDLGGGHTAIAISAGGLHTCAILNDRSVRCWGSGTNGQLGYGATTNVGGMETPAAAGPVHLGPGRTAEAISAGATDTCAILDDGSVRCWGYAGYGELGYGNQTSIGDTPNETPGIVGPVNLGPERTAVAISAGTDHTCARLDNGGVRCWGDGAEGELGYCGTSNVGDASGSTPDTAGPVNLVLGDGGELCPPIPVNTAPPTIAGQTIEGETLTEAHGAWTPTPTGYAHQWERCDVSGAGCSAIAGATGQTYTLGAIDAGSTIRVLEAASDSGGGGITAASAQTAVVTALTTTVPSTMTVPTTMTVPITGIVSQAARDRGWRSCLARVSRRHARGRARCVKLWGRTPGRVTGVNATAVGSTRIELDFSAPGTDAIHPPAATSYLIEQSRRPIRSQHQFVAAHALCHGACVFTVTQIGTSIELTVTGLHPQTMYYYAIEALDNVTGQPGPRSAAVTIETA